MRKTALIFAIIGLCSCRREAPAPLMAEEGLTYSISATLECDTKGNIADDSALDAFSWIILRGDIVLYSGTGNMGGLRLTANAKYNVIAWVGTSGGLDLDVDDALELLEDYGLDGVLDLVYSFSSQRSDWLGLKLPASYYAGGISPSELDALDGSPDGNIHLPLRRLTAKLNLDIQCDDMLRTMFPSETVGAQAYGVAVNSVALGGISQNVGLFKSERNTRNASTGTLDQTDGALTYSFYVPESLGGELLPGNTSPAGKNYQAVLAAGANPNAYPYVEVSITFSAYKVSSPFTKTYRFYLGGNSTSNFDVVRNHEYNITLLLGWGGLDVSDTWKLSGETSALDGRSCGLQSCKTHAAAGEKIVLTANYEYNGGGNSAADFYLRPNGFALCTGADKISWLSTGTQPSGFTQLGEDSYILECRECHHYYTGLPASTGSTRQVWMSSNLAMTGNEAYCMWCGAFLFRQGGAEDWFLFNKVSGTFTGTNVNCLNQYSCDFEYTVPKSAQVGDVIRLWAVTRDGGASSYVDITVSNQHGYPRFESSLGDKIYVAQKTSLTATRWARGIYGNKPSFSFSISAENSSGAADSGVAIIGANYSNSVSISAKKPGTFTVTCTCNGMDAGAFSGTISAPGIGYPGAQTSHSLTVGNNGVATTFTNPVYIIQDGGEWVEYTSYDASLFASCLGTPTGSLSDGKGWIGWSSGSPSTVYLEHAYRNGVTEDGNLVPYQTPSARLDQIRFRSPILSGPHCDIPVYFDPKYSSLALIDDYGTYYNYIADSNLIPSQNSTQFNVASHWADLIFPSDEFFAEADGTAVPLNQVINGQTGGNYSYVTGTLGSKRVYWQLKGTAADNYQLDICRIRVKQKYIGSITISCDADNTETLTDRYAGFASWNDTPVGSYNTYETFEVTSKTLQGFRVYVGCRNLVKDLFRINHTAMLPTQDVYDPSPATGNTHNWNFYHSESDAVYYSQAKHVYDDTDLSYTAVMARWSSYSYLGLFLRTIETHGFGMEKYKAFNYPLFVPASSPQTIDGVTWTKVSDSGGKAVWESADSREVCEFTYNKW